MDRILRKLKIKRVNFILKIGTSSAEINIDTNFEDKLSIIIIIIIKLVF